MQLSELARKSLQRPGAAAKRLKRCTLGLITSANYQRFIVLGRSRTGSGMLISYLNSHPQVTALGETMKLLNGRPPKQLLAEIYGKQPFYIRAHGFKLFYGHPADADSAETWQQLREMPGLKIIHLKRRNLLRTALSKRRADLGGVWKKTDQRVTEPELIELEANRLVEFFEHTCRAEKYSELMFRGRDLLEISYEDLLADPNHWFSTVTDFLGVGARNPSTHYRQQNTRPTRESIANPEQLSAAMANTKWADEFESWLSE